MKTIRILSTAAIIAAALTSAVLADDTTAAAPRRGPRGHGPGQHRQGPPPEIVAKYDANQDGKLDETERAALHADIEAGKVARPEGGRPEGGRGPGAGPRRQGPPPEIVAKYDTNQDGKLDETERAALHADIEAGKVPRPEGGRPEGGRGPGAGGRKGGGRGRAQQ
jgi:translation initiation factor IF-2